MEYSLASLNDREYVLRNASLGDFVVVGMFKKRVKQSRYRPGVVQRVPGR